MGGQIIQQWAGRAKVWNKGPADLVTQADLASQEAIQKVLLDAFPDHSLLGEEPGAGVAAALDPTQCQWILDPLDGTTNFVHGVPHYCVSLALHRRGQLLVGAVYDPLRDECYSAAAQRGARLNGEPIHSSSVGTLSESLAAVGFPPGVSPEAPDLALFLDMLGRCQAIRRTGSSALNLCYLAAGRFDVYWSYSTHVWDVAAGMLILREAGGAITAPDGGEFRLEEARFLAAANPALHAQLLEAARRVVVGRPR